MSSRSGVYFDPWEERYRNQWGVVMPLSYGWDADNRIRLMLNGHLGRLPWENE